MMENSLVLIPSSSFLEKLPVEILHRILDKLGIEDILFSFRHVCKKFYSITNMYDRLSLELSNHSSDTCIDRLYRIISPENVGILILRKCYLNNELNNIDRFFTYDDIHRFTRLRSVRLESMSENDFRTIMRHLATLSTFRSLTIFDRRLLKNDTIILLSTVIALESLRKLDLDISSRIIDQISWPNHGTFHELILKKCSYKQWRHILLHSPNLRFASITDFDMINIDKIVVPIAHHSLTSLVLNDIRFPIAELEMLLLSHPSLTYFDLTATETSSFQNLQRLSQWEYFIREKLPRLENFRFKISGRMSRYQDFESINSIIAAFRTQFWLEYKCWYVRFQYVINNEGSRFIIGSSINRHVNYFQNLEEGFISYSTSTTKDDDGPKMRNVWNALFNLPEVKQAIDFRKFKIPKHYLFDNVIQLGLDIDCFDDWQRSSSFELLSKLINLSQLKDICFFLSFKQSFQASQINTILEKAPDVRTFTIKNNGTLRSSIETQCGAISRQINHLTIQSPDTSAMKLIVEHVEHLSTFTFKCDWSSSTTWTEMIKWLREKEREFAITDDHRSIKVWLQNNMTK